ncbi:autotransporter outer membrane beta-barrel domain-containing protein [Stenotrophomonas sp. PD6]|uniref:autotransporter family protein n=1 Tax=Stenotrophomonas sp. PD6 TaxID=3368612 RepID=UPI003BA19DD6
MAGAFRSLVQGTLVMAGACTLVVPRAQAQPCVVTASRIAMTSGQCEVVPGTELHAAIVNAAVSATNVDTQIDLRPGATVIASTPLVARGVEMINGGKVLLGPDSRIQLESAGQGVLGISISNSRFATPIGTGIPVDMTRAVGNSGTGYGVRAVLNSDVTLGLNLTSSFSNSAFGVRADSGSRVVLVDNSSIALSGTNVSPGGAAVMAVDDGSIIDARNGTRLINVGRDVSAIYMSNGGLVLADATTQLSLTNLAPINAGAAGIVADNTVVPAGTIDGVSMGFTGIAGTGITATRGASVTLRNATVQGAGMGVVADTLSSVDIRASHLSITDTNGGILRTIEPGLSPYSTTYLRQGAGLLALGGRLDADGVGILVPANDAYGVYATFSPFSPSTTGTLTFANGTIATSGVGAYGAAANGSPFVDGMPAVVLSRATVTTGNAGAHGLAVTSGGGITASDSVIRAEGPGSNGLYSSTASTTRANVATISGGSLTSVQSTAVQVAGSQLTLLLSNGVDVAGGNGTLLDVAAVGSRVGTLFMTANAAMLQGAASTQAGSRADMILQAGTQWNMTGRSNLSTLINQDSAIAFGAPSGAPERLDSYKTLTAGAYAGEGGTLALHTYLGGDGSPSDRLVIDAGTATGQTGLHILRAGGDGAVTLGNGIPVVETLNGAVTSAGAFTLRQRVVEGPYEYQLVRGSRDGSQPQGWYLTSLRLPEEPAPEPPPTPPAPPNPPVPPPTEPEAELPAVAPLYRPEVGGYLANQRNAAGMFVHSLHDRLGEPGWPGTERAMTAGDAPSMWLRAVGRDGRSRSEDGTFDVDTEASLIQLGADLGHWQAKEEGGSVHVGGMLGYGSARSGVLAAGNPARSRGETRGWSMGAYATWYQNARDARGWYIDGWALYGGFRNTVQGDNLPDVRYDSHTLALSAETGYAATWGQGNAWAVEPQLQLVHLRYDEDTVTEVNGTRVSDSTGTGWVSRVGVRTHRTWSDRGTEIQPYLTLNWWHDHIPDRLAFNAVTLDALYPSERYEAKLGINAQLGADWSAWGNLGFQWGSQHFTDTSVRVGARYRW